MLRAHLPARAEHDSPQWQVSGVRARVHVHISSYETVFLTPAVFSKGTVFCGTMQSPSLRHVFHQGFGHRSPVVQDSFPQGLTAQTEKDKCFVWSWRPDSSTGTGKWNFIRSLIRSSCFSAALSVTVHRANLIRVPLLASARSSIWGLRAALFNARFVGTPANRCEISNYISKNAIDLTFLTETWLRFHGDEAKIADLAPSATPSSPSHAPPVGVALLSFSRPVFLLTSLSSPTLASLITPLNSFKSQSQCSGVFCIFSVCIGLLPTAKK